jgi:hypothetical protein
MVTYAGVTVPAEDEKVSLKFSSTMSNGDFFKWLQSKGISEKDCNTLLGMYTKLIPLIFNVISYYRKNNIFPIIIII